jgi:hypothetical protein
MHGWDQYGFNKNRVGTCYSEHVFFYPMGSAGHVVHSGTFEEQNVDTLFFMLGRDRYGFNKKRVRSRNTELVFCF